MGSPTVSILLPSRNVGEFLKPCINSLLQQTFADWEAIVLDSQSTDGTWEYFQSVAQRDPRFQLHRVPHRGLYASLNRGFELAAGKSVQIATCDDTVAPEFLAEMLDALAKCPQAGVAVCDVLFIDRNGDPLSEQTSIKGLSKRSARTLLSLDVVRTAFPGSAPSKLNFRPVPHDCLLHFEGR